MSLKAKYEHDDFLYFHEASYVIDQIIGQAVMEATLPIATPKHPADDQKPCDDYNARVCMYNAGACMVARKITEKWHEMEVKPNVTES